MNDPPAIVAADTFPFPRRVSVGKTNPASTQSWEMKYLMPTILRFFPEGRLMLQAERGWAGNNGRMGRVGETTASSHQHRCRYRVILVSHRRTFGESNDARRVFTLAVAAE